MANELHLSSGQVSATCCCLKTRGTVLICSGWVQRAQKSGCLLTFLLDLDLGSRPEPAAQPPLFLFTPFRGGRILTRLTHSFRLLACTLNLDESCNTEPSRRFFTCNQLYKGKYCRCARCKKNKSAPDGEWLGGAITSVACIVRRKSFMYLL